MNSRACFTILVGLAVIMWASTTSAQPPQAPPQDMVIQPDGTTVVRDLPQGPPPVVHREIPLRTPDLDALTTTKRVFGGTRTQLPPGPQTLATTTTTSTLLTSGSTDGLELSNSGGYVPPDTQVGVSPGYVVEAVNLEARIWSRSTGAIVKTFSLTNFFNAGQISDPKIRFDPASSRWFLAVISYNFSFTQGAWRLGVSRTADPTGAFTVYTVSTSNSAPDFPALAVNDDKVVLTANAFRANSFLGTEFVAINKANVVSGTTASAVYFGPGQGLFTIQPAHPLSSCGGSPCPLYMAAVAFNSASAIRVWAVQGVPGVSSVTATSATASIASLTSPPDAAQLGTSTLIQTNDNRLLEATFRNGVLWVSANSACVPAGDSVTRACMRFIQLSVAAPTSSTSAPGIRKTQDFDFGAVGAYYYFAAIQTDASGNLIAVFSQSSSSQYAGVWASGQKTSDGANTFRTPVVLQPGQNSYKPFANRWGDYSGAALDPSNSAVVWVAGEYARIQGGSEWGTSISAVQIQ